MLNSTLSIDLQSIANRRAIIFTLVCGVFGFIVNLFPVTLFSNISLVFGPAFSLLVALSVGPMAGLIAATIASSALFLVWPHASAVLVFIPEAFVVGWLYRRQWNELLAVFIYGLVVGVVYVLASSLMMYDAEHSLDLIGTYLMNSFLYTLVASALLWGFSVPKWLQLDFHRVYTLRTQIFTLLIVSMTMPLAAVSIYQTKNDQETYLVRVNKELSSASRVIAQSLNLFLKENRIAIQKQAELLSLQSPKLLSSSSALKDFHMQHQSFKSTLIADSNGNITAFNSLASDYDAVSLSVADRNYFIQAMLGHVFVSPVFKARGPRENPIVAISAPIRSLQNEVTGILEGSLNLESFSTIVEQQGSFDIPRRVVILDATEQVVFLTDGIEKHVLDQVDWLETPSSMHSSFKLNSFMSDAAISVKALLPNNWQVISFYSLKDFDAYSRQKYRNLGLALSTIILIIGSLAAFLSYQINGPISWLLKRTINFNVDDSIVKPIQISPLVPREMVTLIRAHESAERRLRLAFKSEEMHQLKRARAEQANEAKSDFLSSMSHELRTPLNAISGFSQLLNIDESLPQEAKSMANEIHVASQYLMLLINDILDMSKIESGKLELVIEDVALDTVFEQSLPLLNGLAQVNQVSINLQPFDPVIVSADALRLKQVIINLVSNAIKYNRTKGKVTIQVSQQEECCCFEITDTGHGIEQARVDELFQPFNRLSHERSNIEGFGIGLTVTKKLLALMGGSIEVESQLGKGSCFRVYLPVAINTNLSEEFSNINITTDGINGLKPCRVLYVEDNHLNALVMQKAMQRFPQIEYVREASGRAGLARIEKQVFDIVLLDITLPDMSGYEVFKRMRQQYSNNYGSVFAVSANAMSDDIDKGLAAGFDHYVTKPIKFNLLFELIQQQINLMPLSESQ